MTPIGQLLQYKRQYYGKYYAKLPTMPFEAITNYLIKGIMAWDASQTETTKKIILMSTKVVLVSHPRIKTIQCEYLQCFISNPYSERETIDGWVRPEWLEPLNKFQTYEGDLFQKLNDIYKLSKEKQEKQEKGVEVKTPLQIFQELKKK